MSSYFSLDAALAWFTSRALRYYQPMSPLSPTRPTSRVITGYKANLSGLGPQKLPAKISGAPTVISAWLPGAHPPMLVG